jgi:putative transcriptional regulator
MSEVGKDILKGLQEALAFVKGEADPATYRVHTPKMLDVAAIRKKTGMTQDAFAIRFGVSVNTLRHWEQGKRYPEGPARTLLKVIDKEPEAVVRALRAA